LLELKHVQPNEHMHMTTLVKIAKNILKFDFSKKLTQMENVNFYWTLFFTVVLYAIYYFNRIPIKEILLFCC